MIPVTSDPPRIISQRHRPWILNVGVAMSMANLCLVRASYSTLYSSDFGYFNQIPVNAVTLIGLALSMLFLTMIFWLVTTGLQRVRWVWLKRIGHLAGLALFLIPLDFVRLNLAITGLAQHSGFLLVLAGIVAVVGCRYHSLVARVVGGVALILLPLAFLTWIRLLLLLLSVVFVSRQSNPLTLAPLLPVGENQPRIVWLVFDELDYHVMFENRPVNLSLPELDRLRSESFFATDAFPPAFGTIRSIPALITGKEVLSASPCARNDLALTFAGTNVPVTWSSVPNVFSSARELGFNSAVVAWYHPFPRVFSNSLSLCFWYAFPLFEQARGNTLGEAIVNQLWSVISFLQQRRLHLQIYQHSLSDTLQVVTNQRYGITFLNLPGAHWPGIYLRDKKRFTTTEFSTVQGYLNNLALTDQCLGKLRQQMESAGVWDKTWMIVSSDHWWRNATRYDGKNDQRVPFIVKSPGHSEAVEFPTRFNTLITQELVLSILRGEVHSTTETRDWLVKNLVNLP